MLDEPYPRSNYLNFQSVSAGNRRPANTRQIINEVIKAKENFKCILSLPLTSFFLIRPTTFQTNNYASVFTMLDEPYPRSNYLNFQSVSARNRIQYVIIGYQPR
jgi:hypothetical protein